MQIDAFRKLLQEFSSDARAGKLTGLQGDGKDLANLAESEQGHRRASLHGYGEP